MKPLTKNILIILFLTWIVTSFLYLYYGMTTGMLPFIFPYNFTNMFCEFSIYILLISFFWLGFIFTNGKFKNIGSHLREIIVFSAILLVASFIVIKWTSVTTQYGSYGLYSKTEEGIRFHYQYLDHVTSVTPYEQELILQGAMKYVYDRAFKQMWTFGAFVFLSTFLLLAVIPKREETEQ